jgi:gamma-glutamylputrescine oxidase
LLINSKMPSEIYPDSYYAASISRPFEGESLNDNLDTDICVIGGGYTGVSAALHLAQRGHSVVLLEAHKIGWGASGRNGGHVCTGQRKEQEELEKMLDIDHARQLWVLSEEAKHTVRTLIKDFKIDCDYKTGIAHPDHKPQYAEASKRFVDKLNSEYDYEQIEYLDAEKMARITGSKGYFGGTLDHGAGHLHPLNYVLGMAHAARAHGARIFENCSVNDYTVEDRVSVHSGTFTVRARRMVLACNGYLSKLEPRLAGRIMPINNFIAATEPLDEETARRINPRDIAIADSRFVVNYYRMSADKRLLFGGGENYRASFPADIANFVRKPMLQIHPELEKTRIDFAWGGTLAVTLNRLPHFGTLDNGRILYAQGYSGQGVALATLAGKLISEKIDGEDNRFEAIASLPTPQFPGGTMLRWPAMVLGMAYYALRDRI